MPSRVLCSGRVTLPRSSQCYLPVALVYWSFRCVSTPKPSELFCLGKSLWHPFLSDVF